MGGAHSLGYTRIGYRCRSLRSAHRRNGSFEDRFQVAQPEPPAFIVTGKPGVGLAGPDAVGTVGLLYLLDDAL